MTNIEKVKYIRDITMSPMNKINKALEDAQGNVDKAIELLIKQKETTAEDMANRRADNSIVYSYVHNNKIGAMIVLACQTDFVAKNELFIQLAKDICMHIVSSPVPAIYIDDVNIPKEELDGFKIVCIEGTSGKPQNIAEKIIMGKLNKKLDEVCLIRQNFIKDDSVIIKDLINKVSGTVGEKIEIKKFIRISV